MKPLATSLRNSTLPLATTLLAASLAFASAEFPLPDLVLFGRVYDPGTGTIVTQSRIDPQPLTVEAVYQGTTVATTSQLLPADDPTVGEIYLLRIKRQAGPAATIPEATVAGDQIRILLDNQEVEETAQTPVLITGSLTQQHQIDLNAPPTIAELYRTFAATLANNNSSIDDDFDDDDLSNVFEWYLALDPTLPDPASQASADRLPATGVQVVDGRQFATFTHTRRSGLPGNLHAAVSVSPDMDSWTDAAANLVPVGPPTINGDGTETLTLRYTIPLDEWNAASLFFRLELDY